jgi:hypothetical protein
MADFIDLISTVRDNPEYLKSALQNQSKLAKFKLTSAELDTLRKLRPDAISVIVVNLEQKLRAVTYCVACIGGTNACMDHRVAKSPEAIQNIPPHGKSVVRNSTEQRVNQFQFFEKKGGN